MPVTFALTGIKMKNLILPLLALLLAACDSGEQTSVAPAPQLSTPAAVPYDVSEKSLQQIHADLSNGVVTSEELVKLYIARIESIDQNGPRLNSVISLNPDAIKQAQQLDQEMKERGVRSALHGIPILIKDNIETADNMPTTAGSLALKDNITQRDSPSIAKLRTAGAVILGKTNLSEWANIRSTRSTSGWSAMGGLSKNPYALDRNTCGSSAGTGAAIAASLATLGIGTETDGSITCPSSANGLVGLKPTVGLISRTHIVPISHSQDTAGPMTRDVYSAAAMLTVMAGSDVNDEASKETDSRKTNYLSAIDNASLQGKRFGVLRFVKSNNPDVNVAFDEALQKMRDAGAEIIDINESRNDGALQEQEFAVLMTETKADLNAYLATTPTTVKTRTLAEVIQFNRDNRKAEMRFFGQELFERAEATKGLSDAAYLKAKKQSQTTARQAIDGYLKKYKVNSLIFFTLDPAWTSDLVNGDHYTGGGAGYLAAISGYPHLTVPMDYVNGLPVGISFIGSAWTEGELLANGYAFEQLTKARRPPSFAINTVELLGLK